MGSVRFVLRQVAINSQLFENSPTIYGSLLYTSRNVVFFPKNPWILAECYHIQKDLLVSHTYPVSTAAKEGLVPAKTVDPVKVKDVYNNEPFMAGMTA